VPLRMPLGAHELLVLGQHFLRAFCESVLSHHVCVASILGPILSPSPEQNVALDPVNCAGREVDQDDKRRQKHGYPQHQNICEQAISRKPSDTEEGDDHQARRTQYSSRCLTTDIFASVGQPPDCPVASGHPESYRSQNKQEHPNIPDKLNTNPCPS